MTRREEPGATVAAEVTAAWLLSAAERDNPATTIDAQHGQGRAWTVGNLVRVHVDGAACPARRVGVALTGSNRMTRGLIGLAAALG